MARPVYSTQFVAEAIPSGTDSTGILPVLGTIAVVRDIEVWTAAGGIGNSIGAYLFPAGIKVIEWNNLSAGHNSQQWTGRMVVTPEIYLLLRSDIGDWNAIVSGYVLTDA